MILNSSVLGGMILGTVPPGGAYYTTASASEGVSVTGSYVTLYTSPVTIIGNAVVSISFDYYTIATRGLVTIEGDANIIVNTNTLSSNHGSVTVVGSDTVYVGSFTVSAICGIVRTGYLANIIGSNDTSIGTSDEEQRYEEKYYQNKVEHNVKKIQPVDYTVYVKGSEVQTQSGNVTVIIEVNTKREKITLVENHVIVPPKKVVLKKLPPKRKIRKVKVTKVVEQIPERIEVSERIEIPVVTAKRTPLKLLTREPIVMVQEFVVPKKLSLVKNLNAPIQLPAPPINLHDST